MKEISEFGALKYWPIRGAVFCKIAEMNPTLSLPVYGFLVNQPPITNPLPVKNCDLGLFLA